jgi:hypothetical protein
MAGSMRDHVVGSGLLQGSQRCPRQQHSHSKQVEDDCSQIFHWHAAE